MRVVQPRVAYSGRVVDVSKYPSPEAAMAACVSGDLLYMPPGAYTSDAPPSVLQLPTGVNGYAMGATLILADPAASLAIDNASTIKFPGLEINAGGVATHPFRVGTGNEGQGAKSCFPDWHIHGTAAGGIAAQVLGLQNSSFPRMRLLDNDDAACGLLVDEGSKSIRFPGLHSSSVSGPNAHFTTSGRKTLVPWTRVPGSSAITFNLPSHSLDPADPVIVSDSTSTAAMPDGATTVTSEPDSSHFVLTGINAGATSGFATITGLTQRTSKVFLTDVLFENGEGLVVGDIEHLYLKGGALNAVGGSAIILLRDGARRTTTHGPTIVKIEDLLISGWDIGFDVQSLITSLYTGSIAFALDAGGIEYSVDEADSRIIELAPPTQESAGGGAPTRYSGPGDEDTVVNRVLTLPDLAGLPTLLELTAHGNTGNTGTIDFTSGMESHHTATLTPTGGTSPPNTCTVAFTGAVDGVPAVAIVEWIQGTGGDKGIQYTGSAMAGTPAVLHTAAAAADVVMYVTWDGGATVFVIPLHDAATSGGGAVAVKEEGTTVVATATAINFVGASVTVTDGGGGVAVVTITDATLTTEEVQDIVGALIADSAVTDVTYDDAGNALTITLLAGAVANSMLANMAQSTIKGRAAGAGTGAPTDLSAAQVFTILGVSAFMQTVLDDADAATARATLGAVGLTGNETVAGIKTFSSAPVVPADPYGAGWNGKQEPAPKDAVYDQIQSQAILGDGKGTTVNTTDVPGEAHVDVNPPDVQEFTANGTWTKPSWAHASSVVDIEVVGAGGGGGSGRRGAASSLRGAGGGGASGCVSRLSMLAGDLGATETVSVPAGGAGGGAAGGNDTDGSDGIAGQTSSFGVWVAASGGGGGAKGTGAGGGAGGAVGTRGMFPGLPGGAGAGTAAAPSIAGDGLFSAPSSNNGGGLAASGAGGGGAAIDAGNTTRAAAAGGGANAYTAGTAGGAAATGNLGGQAGAAVTDMIGTGGGGGGRATTADTIAGGGAGGTPGAGGGGAGGATNGFTANAGGAGGRGFARAITRR